MTALVTGGCGFIGRHLVSQLRARGDAVRVLDLGPFEDLPDEVETIQGSITDPAVVRRAVDGVGTVYHLAAYPHLWARSRRLFEDVNVEGTRIVLAAAKAARILRVVHGSSLTVLMTRRNDGGEVRIDEGRETRLDDMLGPYCRSKFLAERAALAAAAEGLPVVVVLPTLPVGPGDRNLTPPSRMILDFVNGRAPAYLDCRLNLIDVRDLAAGLIAAAERGRIGERYILGNENIYLSELLDLLSKVTELPINRARRLPYALAQAAAWVDETLADLVTHRPPRAPLTGVRLAGVPALFDSTKARRDLGLPQSPIRDALKDQLLWMRARGWITRPLPGLK
jgi:dihydroflavonol-4-reductase